MKNSRPEGDVWNLKDNDKESQWYGKNFKFDFSYINSEEIKDVVKDFVWQNYRTGNRSPKAFTVIKNNSSGSMILQMLER